MNRVWHGWHMPGSASKKLPLIKRSIISTSRRTLPRSGVACAVFPQAFTLFHTLYSPYVCVCEEFTTLCRLVQRKPSKKVVVLFVFCAATISFIFLHSERQLVYILALKSAKTQISSESSKVCGARACCVK